MHMVVYRYELKPNVVEAFVEFLEKDIELSIWPLFQVKLLGLCYL